MTNDDNTVDTDEGNTDIRIGSEGDITPAVAHGKGLHAGDHRGTTDQKRLAALLLVGGMRKTDVAIRLGIDYSTLYRWEQQPAFRAYLEQLRRDVVDETVDAAREAAYQAVLAVRDAVLEGDARAAIEYLKLVGVGKVQLTNGLSGEQGGGSPALPSGDAVK